MSPKLYLRHLRPSLGLLLVVGLLIGVFATLQLQAPPIHRVTSPASTLFQLERVRDELTTEHRGHEQAIQELQVAISQHQERLARGRTTRATAERVERYRELAGLSPRTGSGVVVTLDSAPDSPDGAVFSSDLRDVINALWEAGAEAISVNGQRVVTTTSIDTLLNTTLINATKTTVPYVVHALGSSRTIERALRNAPGLADLRGRADTYDLVFDTVRSRELVIPAFTGAFTIEYAQPASEVS